MRNIKYYFYNLGMNGGEGNYVEPDLKYGRKFLDVLRELLISK